MPSKINCDDILNARVREKYVNNRLREYTLSQKKRGL
jgi:hypothetical protein